MPRDFGSAKYWRLKVGRGNRTMGRWAEAEAKLERELRMRKSRKIPCRFELQSDDLEEFRDPDEPIVRKIDPLVKISLKIFKKGIFELSREDIALISRRTGILGVIPWVILQGHGKFDKGIKRKSVYGFFDLEQIQRQTEDFVDGQDTFVSGLIMYRIQQGTLELMEGKWQEALSDFDSILSRFPAFADVWRMTAICFYISLHPRLATKRIEKALELDQTNVSSLVWAAAIYAKLCDFDRVSKLVQQATTYAVSDYDKKLVQQMGNAILESDGSFI